MEEFSTSISTRTRPAKCLMGVTLLLVEDSRSTSEALRMMASVSGSRIRRADSLQAAQRHLGSFRPSVALVDISLPDGDGIELIKIIKEREDQGIPVIAMSGLDKSEVEKRALEAGAAAFLEKPIEKLSLFQHTILEVLPDRETAAAQNMRFDARIPDLDPSFLELDLENACDLLREGIQAGDALEMHYCAKFMIGVAKQMQDERLMQLAVDLDAQLADSGQGEAIAADLLVRIESLLGSLQAATG